MCSIDSFGFAAFSGIPFGKGGEYPVISLKRPWIDLILGGLKSIETRTRPIPRTTHGRIVLLHASRTWREDFKNIISMEALDHLNYSPEWRGEDREGKILLAVEFSDSIEYESLDHFDDDSPRHCVGIAGYHPGIFGWIIRKAWRIDPIQFKGGQFVAYYTGAIHIREEIQLNGRVR